MRNSLIILVILTLSLCLFTTGCRKGIKVYGKVTYEDGQPLTKGTVCFQGEKILARGDLNEEGFYKLGLEEPNTKIPFGNYKVFISGAIDIEELPLTKDREVPKLPKETPLIDFKYMSADSSEMACEVKSGMTLPYDIKVTAPGKAKK